MKKIKFLIITSMLFLLTGCITDDAMNDINISTSVYPIEYVTKVLYGDNSTISSIYPKDTEVIDFEVTDVLLNQYSDSDLFIFNGISNEKNYVKTLLKKNNDLKIIDVTSNMNYEFSMEELWLDPNQFLTIANNARKGFKEYIKSSYLINKINENYENLKVELTTLDGKYYSMVKNASNTTIIVSDDAFKYLKKYGINVISIDPDTSKTKDIEDAKEAIKSGKCNYIFIKYKEDSDTLNNFIEESGAHKIELYTMTNLEGIDIEKMDYITLMNQNLENLKLELYK